jgi:hypothetical protein
VISNEVEVDTSIKCRQVPRQENPSMTEAQAAMTAQLHVVRSHLQADEQRQFLQNVQRQ